MIHQRIRPFNTKDTYPDQDLDNDLSQAVIAGDVVYMRGQVGTDFEGNLVGEGDAAAQADQAMKNVAVLLDECGASLAEVVKIVIYLVNSADREAVYRVVGHHLKGVHPVSTGVVVAGLAKADWLMEIDVTAVLARASEAHS